jgi:molecular chaperone GrpE
MINRNRKEDGALAPDKEWEITENEEEREPSSESHEREAEPAEEEHADPTTVEEAVVETAGAGEASETSPREPEAPSVETLPAESEEDPELVQKRIKRARRKELLDLIQRKNAMLMELDKELRKTKQELENKEDRLLRLAAEFENYKKRTRREWELLQKNANADLIKEIIWGIDNFDRAFANLGGAEDHIQEGIRLIHAGLMDILKKAGLTEIDAQNQKFDAQFHEAVGEIESDIEEGHVAQVIQRGYMLNNQVLRPARVLVSKAKG